MDEKTVRRVRESYLDARARRCGLDAQWASVAWDFGGGVYVLDNEDSDRGYVLGREIMNADGETAGFAEIFYTNNVRMLVKVAEELADSVATRNLDLED